MAIFFIATLYYDSLLDWYSAWSSNLERKLLMMYSYAKRLLDSIMVIKLPPLFG